MRWESLQPIDEKINYIDPLIISNVVQSLKEGYLESILTYLKTVNQNTLKITRTRIKITFEKQKPKPSQNRCLKKNLKIKSEGSFQSLGITQCRQVRHSQISIQIPNNRVKSDNHEELVRDISMAMHTNKKQNGKSV